MRCLITGVASGIGEALAREFSQWGFGIVGVDRDVTRGETLMRELSTTGSPSTFVAADLLRPDAAEPIVEAAARLGSMRILIHSAGTNAVGRFGTIEVPAQQDVLALNLRAPMDLTGALLRRELIGSGGSIVFISSLARFVGYPGAAAYAASKCGLSAYARSLAVALAPRRIHVLTVYPGATRTPHAKRFSPDNRNEHRRMPASHVATAVRRGVIARRRVVIPGIGNKIMAALGFVNPRLTEWAMRRLILERLDADRRPTLPSSV